MCHVQWVIFISGTAAQKELVIGGELCMWGEFADANDVVPVIWWALYMS